MAESISQQQSEFTKPENLKGDCVVAIDPGRAKCGIAVVQRDSATLFRSIVLTTNLSLELARIVSAYRPKVIAIGNGTGSKQVVDLIRNSLTKSVPIRSLDESYTSEEARRRFIREVKPRGLQRLIPLQLRTPTQAYDDYVAMILGERFWQDLAIKSSE